VACRVITMLLLIQELRVVTSTECSESRIWDMTPDTLQMSVHYDDLSTTYEMCVESSTGKLRSLHL
jgi:hypothetical protein